MKQATERLLSSVRAEALGVLPSGGSDLGCWWQKRRETNVLSGSSRLCVQVQNRRCAAQQANPGVKTKGHSRKDRHLEAWGYAGRTDQLSWFLKTTGTCAGNQAR